MPGNIVENSILLTLVKNQCIISVPLEEEMLVYAGVKGVLIESNSGFSLFVSQYKKYVADSKKEAIFRTLCHWFF